MKFTTVFVTLAAITYVAASPEFVTEDHPAVRDIIDTYGSENLVRDNEGVLYRRFQAGVCLRTGRCKTLKGSCAMANCSENGGFPCACP